MFTFHHVWHFTCHVSHVICFSFWQSARANWWRFCYWRGIPRLVFKEEWVLGTIIYSFIKHYFAGFFLNNTFELLYITLLWCNAIREIVYLGINVAKMAFSKKFPQLCITYCEDLKVRIHTSSRKVNINNKCVSWYPWIFTSTGVHQCCSRSPILFCPCSTHSHHMDSSVKMWWVLQDGKVEVGFTLHNNPTYLYRYFDQFYDIFFERFQRPLFSYFFKNLRQYFQNSFV